VTPGATTAEIDRRITEMVAGSGAISATIGYKGYQHASGRGSSLESSPRRPDDRPPVTAERSGRLGSCATSVNGSPCTGVDPVSWTPNLLREERSPRWERDGRIRRSTGST
jgi:hypothetical protein